MKKILVSIGGFDPSGGAGVLLDVKVFGSLGFQGMAVLTALTIQDTSKVRLVLPFSVRTLKDEFATLSRDVSFAGIKSGLLGSRENAVALGRMIQKHPDIPKVVDPVLRSSSGACFFETKALPAFLRSVSGRVSLLTPNLAEASLLAGIPVATPYDMLEAAKMIFDVTAVPCLVKGGHLKKSAINILYDGHRTAAFGHDKLKKDVHGTGCFLSAGILAFLARGHSLEKSCGLGTDLTHDAIRSAVKPGKGRFIFDFSRSPIRRSQT